MDQLYQKVPFHRKILKEVDKRIWDTIGSNIYNYQWDILIILDACRYDLFEQYVEKHDCQQHLIDTRSMYSVASSTQTWLPRTFLNAPSRVVNETHYVSGSGQVKKHLPENIFHDIEHVWKYAHDPSYGQTNVRAITDAAIEAIQNSDASRHVIHYPEPHAPFHHCIGKYDAVGQSQTVWKMLSDNEVTKKEVWHDYGQNLMMALDEVQTIINNVTGDIIISSDHGNSLGEYGFYGHPRHVPTPELRRVPLARAEGLDLDTYTIKGRKQRKTDTETLSVDQNLRALGYI